MLKQITFFFCSRISHRVGRPDGGSGPRGQARLLQLAAQPEDYAAGVWVHHLRLRQPDAHRALPARCRRQVRVGWR